MLPFYGHDTPIPNTQGSCTSVTKPSILWLVKLCQTVYFIAAHSVVCTTICMRIRRLPGRVFTAQPATPASPRMHITVLLVPRPPRRQSQTWHSIGRHPKLAKAPRPHSSGEGVRRRRRGALPTPGMLTHELRHRPRPPARSRTQRTESQHTHRATTQTMQASDRLVFKFWKLSEVIY